MDSPLIDGIPLDLLFVVTVMLILASVEAGVRFGRYRRRRSTEEREAPVGSMAGAALALLGFLLAFTFGMAASRSDVRRELVMEEANAIGTAYLRAGLLPEPRRATAQASLREYVDVRLRVLLEHGGIDLSIRRSEELQSAIWAEATAVSEKDPHSITAGLFIQAVNEVIDIHSKRVRAFHNRIPATIWLVLYAVAILSMATLGYYSGLSDTHSTPSMVVLSLIFAAVLWLIADLDSSHRGLLRNSHRALQDLQQQLRKETASGTAKPST